MKSKSPFKAKIDIFQGSTSTYRHPSTVIQPIVGAQIGAQIAKTAGEVASKAITAKSKKPKEQFDFTVPPMPEITNIFGDKSSGSDKLKYRTIQTDQANTGVSYDESFSKLKKDKDGKAVATGDFKGGDSKAWEKYVRNYNKRNINQERDEKYDASGELTYVSDWRERTKSPNTMKGSPAKQIDPYAAINPEAVPGTQDQTLGNRDFRFNQDPIAPGRLGSASSVNTQNQIFGGGQAQTAAEQLQTPLYDKGHADDYDGHTHRKKGGSYKVGDYMDETDMETSYPKLYTQDVGEIKKDKKSQYMISKNEDYNPTKIDTIRPLKGKTFKMGWGDAERNISTNPKYKKSK